MMEQNLQLLRNRFPDLYTRVSSPMQDAQLSLQRTKTAYPTLVVQAGGEARALHHPEDPLGYCAGLLDSVPALGSTHNIIVMGLGLGYLPLLLSERHPHFRNLFILEPSLSVLRAAVQAVDQQRLLKDPRVHLIVGAEQYCIYQSLMPFLMELMANRPVMVDNPPITSTFSAWAVSAKEQIEALMRFGQSGLATKLKDGPLTIENLLRNLRPLADSAGILPLRDHFKGVPAIVVAAGPSLNKNVDQLRDAQGRFLIVACDTSLEPLLKRGIQPHFIVTVDPTALNLRHFPQERYGGNSILLMEPEARPEITEKFERRLSYVTDKHEFFAWLDKAVGGKGMLKKGGMVSQACFYAAEYFGCDPIVLIGQDLALDPADGATHVREAALKRNVHYIEGDKDKADIPHIDENQPVMRQPLYWVEGVHGEPVPTLHNLMVYLRLVEDDVRKSTARVIDATEGGAKIAGTAVQTLRETIEQYQTGVDVIAGRMQPALDASLQRSAGNEDAVRQHLKILLERQLQTAQKGREFLQKSAQASLHLLEKRLDEFRNQLLSDVVAEYLIEYSAPGELFEFMKLAPADAEEDEKRANLYKRFEGLLDAVEKAVEKLRNILKLEG